MPGGLVWMHPTRRKGLQWEDKGSMTRAILSFWHSWSLARSGLWKEVRCLSQGFYCGRNLRLAYWKVPGWLVISEIRLIAKLLKEWPGTQPHQDLGSLSVSWFALILLNIFNPTCFFFLYGKKHRYRFPHLLTLWVTRENRLSPTFWKILVGLLGSSHMIFP